MSTTQHLHDLSRRFGAGSAAEKVRLLDALLAAPRLSKRDQRQLREVVSFLCAYPDNRRVLERARLLATQLPCPESIYPYSYAVIVRLLRVGGCSLEIDWESLEEQRPVVDALELLLLPGEQEGLADERLSLQDWFRATRPAWARTDLEYFVGLLERSSLPPPARVTLFERCDLPIRYRGLGPHRVAVRTPSVHFQRRDVDRRKLPLPPVIRKPIGRPRRAGQGLIDRCLQALCARQLEIYPLIYANPEDAVWFDCGRGVRVVLVGVLPAWRSALESLYFFMVIKNGVPVAYGPASALAGCCEMGINLFPEFRGAEIRFIYSQFMRVLHHRLGVDYFFLTPYGMGEDNLDALASGAFWFYRKLGFAPSNPAVEALAREEEAHMAADPGHRSDRRTLRRLSHTEAILDLTHGRRTRLDLGRLGLQESRLIAHRHAGDRARARRRCAATMGRLLNLAPADPALRVLAPTLSLIPDLRDWGRADLKRLARFVQAKGAPSEAAAARMLASHGRLVTALADCATAEGAPAS